MINDSHLKELLDIFRNDAHCRDNITRTAQKFCSDNDIVYSDSKRRQVSKVLNSYWESQETEPVRNSPAKILVFDIETAPLKAFVWRLWKQNIDHKTALITPSWYMLTWSAKWLFEDKVISEKLTAKEVLSEDDSRIVKRLWDLINEADIIIAHRGANFDVRQMNTRFLVHKLPPPLTYQVIDTYLHARKRFDMPSHSLNYIGNLLGLGEKIDTGGFKLWTRCLEGDENALLEMEKYNIQDVKLLEDVYLTLRPYINPHPNMGLYIDEDVEVCPSCGSKHITWEGQYATYANLYDSFRCDDCGSIGRSRRTSIRPAHKKHLTVSTP